MMVRDDNEAWRGFRIVMIRIKRVFALTIISILIVCSQSDSATISDITKGGYARKLFISGNYLYLADWHSGLHIYDITYPYKPVHLTNIHTPGSPKGIFVDDNIAYVGDDDRGLQVIDVSDPLSSSVISQLQTQGLAYIVEVVDHLLYVADHRGGVSVIDVNDP